MDEQRAWIKSRRKKRLRLLAAALAFCLLVTTYPDILATLSAFAAGTQDGDGTVYVSGFESLPEEVREQTVPVGTGIEELTLPDALEAVVIAEEEDDPEDKADVPDKDKNPDDSDPKEDNTVSGAGIGTGTSGETGSAETNTETDDNGDAGTDAETGGRTETGDAGTNMEAGSDNGDAGIGTGTGDGISEGGTGSDQTGVGETGNDGADNSDAETDTAPETDKKDEPPAASQEEVPAVQNNPSEETPAAGDIPKEEAAPETIEKESINQESVGTGESASRKEERETYAVTLPVYAAGNELEIEMLESPAKQTETMNPPEQPEKTEQTEAVTIKGVTWESVPEYDGNTEGVYLFTAVLPEGYVLSEGVSLPEIMVTVAKDSAQAEELHALLELLRALPDPEKYISYDEAADKVTKNKEIIDDEQLRSAREAADKYLETYPDTAAADIDTQNTSLDALLARLEGLEHIRDTSGDCSDLGCPYHYPQSVRERMTKTETPELLTLEDLTEDYGVEEPAAPIARTRMKAYGARAAASAPHPQTLMETYDNENNAHTGASDNDLDKLLTGDLHSNLPIEVSFTLNELPTQSAYLAIKAYDVDEEGMEWDYVYINDDIYKPMDKSATGTADRNHPHENEKCMLTWNDSNIGRLAGTDETWNVTVLEIPLEKLVKGKNVISITVAQDWNLEVDWMQLVLDGGAKDADLSGFSLQLNKSVKDNNTVKIYTDAILTQSGTKEYAAEYTLTEESTGNAVDVCIGSISDKKTIEHNMPLDSPTGTYTITGILKDENENIKAIESVKFFFIKDVGMGMKITHTLSPGLLTNGDVTINVNAEPVSSAITDVTVTPKTTGTATTNGTYEFTVGYKVDGTHCTSSYSVKVDNIDKTPPQLTYEKLTVPEDTPQSEVNELFKASLSATDDRKLAEPPFTYTIPSDISNSGGAKNVSVTAADAAGNKTTKNCEITVTAKPLELTIQDAQAVAGSKDSFNLNAVLTHTGTDTITEMGFVWGVMPNPTLELNNGAVKLGTVVTAKGGALSAKATNLVTGVQYNARAYAKVTKAGQTSVVYSDAKGFGFDVPDHGKISVSGVKNVSGGCEFTISRTGGTEGAQTVYYRTVNGSAIGDTHFTHANGSVTFNDGESGSKTVKITEHSVTAVYGGNTATAYSNESRTYSLEIYRVDGGSEIDKNSRSQIRTMSKDSSYTIDKSVYAEQSKVEVAETTKKNGKPVYPTSGGNKINFIKGENGQNYHTSSELPNYYPGNQGEYLKNTMDGWYYRYELTAYFSDVIPAGYYGHAYIGKSALADTTYDPPKISSGGIIPSYKSDLSAPVEKLLPGWTCSFTHANQKQSTYNFPDTATESGDSGKPYKAVGDFVTYGSKNYFELKTGDTCHVYFAKAGNTGNLYVNGLKSYALGYDNTEPKCIGVAPMAGGTYFAGDPITVALVFNEIVDKGNSPNLGDVRIETNVGTLEYAGGADTNVLYFTGTVSSTQNLSGDNGLQVKSIINSENIHDMCSLDIGTAAPAPSYSGNTNVIVDATKPGVTITPNTSGSLPRHQASVTATNAASVQYAWTKSTDTPAGGWQTTANGATLTESRGAAGSTETWYLHILATASTGASTHECQAFTFMQPAITSVSVRASDNDSSPDVSDTWKTFKYIKVQYVGAQVSTDQNPTTLTISLNGKEKALWSLDAASGTKYLKVTENGSYTVTLTDSYGNVLSKVAEVKKIDNTAPTLTLRSGSSTDSAVIHNSVTVAVFPEDNAGGSGLAKVEYAWTNSSNAPTASDWKTLTAANGSYQTTYTAAEATKTQKYLHVRVTDVAGNTKTAQSGPYSVVKEAEPAQMPTITVTTSENGTWTKSATLTWTATAKGSGNSIVRVFVPDKDRAVTATSGTCTVTKNGVYMFSATDSNSNTVSQKVVVQHIDNDAPKLDAITAGLAADTKSGTITLTGVTDNCTNVLNENGKVLSVSGSGINSIEYQHESDPETEWKSLTNAPTISFDVEKNGTYTVRLTDKLNNSRDYTVVMEGIDRIAPAITAELTKEKTGDDLVWYNAADSLKIQLTYSDNKGVSDVLVQVDDGNYTSVTGITKGDATKNETTADYELTEGIHTYTFKAVDKAGNETVTDPIAVNLDTTKPEFGDLDYDSKAKNVLDWIIGKESLIITVPVTDNDISGNPGSGVDEINYTLTPADGSTGAAETTGTVDVKDGKAEITVSADFKGTVKINCSDAAGNAADDKTIGTSGGTGGVIVEDNAPTISALADRGPADTVQTGDTALSESYYVARPEIKVTVKDDIDNAVTAGIASVACLIGETDYPVTVGTAALKGEFTFTIPSDEIPTGSTTIEIKAEDNAGNTASFTFTLKVNGAEKKPAAKIDYQAEKLTGLEPDASYSITYTDGNGAEQTEDVTAPDGTIPLNEEWIGDTIKIVRKGNGSETSDSEEQELDVPERPSAPSSAPELDKRTDTSVTLKRIDGVQYRVNDGDWQDSPEFTGLDPETEYTFEVRYPAKDTAFATPPGDSTKIITMPKAPAEDVLRINYEKETFTLDGGVEAFTDKECTRKVNLEDGKGNAADYMGQPLYIRYSEKDGVPAGMTTKVQIPERPEKPNAGTKDASYPGAQDGSITGLDDSLTYEIREKGADGSFGEWKDARLDGTEITDLPAGEYEVRVKAEKTFRSETVSVTIGEKPTTPYDTPTKVQIDYAEEKLEGFELNEPYTIKYTDNDGTEQTIEITTRDGVVPLEEEWLGKTLSVVHKGNGKDKTDSAAQEFTVPPRPEKPSPAWKDETGLNKKDGKLMGLTPGTAYDISKDGGKSWTERTADAAGEIKGVDAPATYVVRAAATNSGFRGPVCDPVAVDGYHIPVTFMANGETAGTSWAYYGNAPEKIPAVPKKADAGDKTYVGEWCADENGAPADLTNIMAEKTFYAYYTVGYNMILQGGAGYTLVAAPGSVSPVKEGGSFTLKFTLNSGYDKTDGFAVKINGVEIALETDGTYTITDVRGNQTVTVEGIRKKASSGGSGSTGGSDGDSNDSAGGDNNPATDTPSTDDNPSAAGTKPDKTALDKTKPDGTKPDGTASDRTKPGKTASDKAKSDGTAPGSTASDKMKPDETTPGGTASDKTKPGATGLKTVTVSATIENGRIVISGGAGIPQEGEAGETGTTGETGEAGETGTAGMTGTGETGAAAATGTARIMTDGMNGITTVSMVLQIGGDGGGNSDSAGGSVNGSNNANAAGAVIVTVVCEEQAYTAGVADTVAVANAALSPEQIQLVNDGETIEVRIDVKDISSTVSGRDKEIIESGLAEYRKEMPDLTLGMYVDISMFVRNGNGSWNAVTVTEEPVEVVIGIPEELKGKGRKFYIIRSHDGTYALLPDLDDNPDTITVSTNLFSAYAIAYEQADQTDGNLRCGLCHICPTFLGICYFIWIAVIVAALLLIWIVIWRKRKGENN